MSDQAAAVAEGQQPQTEPQSTVVIDYDAQAKADGWDPKEEFRGDPEDWVDAKTWVTREKPGYRHIREVNRQGRLIEELKASRDVLVNHVRKLQEQTAQQRIDALQSSKDDAVSEGNAAEVRKIDSAIEEIRKEEKLPAVASGPTLDPLLVDWAASPERDWYRADIELRVAAARYQDPLVAAGMGVAESLAKTDAYIRRTYPHLFRPVDSSTSDGNGNGAPNGAKPATQQQQPRRNPVATGGARPSPSASRGVTVADLNPLELKIMQGFERDGIMTQDQYLASLSETVKAKGGQT